jgi:hypothetical protein
VRRSAAGLGKKIRGEDGVATAVARLERLVTETTLQPLRR